MNPAAAFPQRYTTVDVVIFTVTGGALRVLLSRHPLNPRAPYPTMFCLPGGYIDIARDATFDDCARRTLREKPGFAAPYLERLSGWDSTGHNPHGWMATHVYFALVPPPDAAAWPEADAACAQPLTTTIFYAPPWHVCAAKWNTLRGSPSYWQRRSPCHSCSASMRPSSAARSTKAPSASAHGMQGSWSKTA